MEWETRKVLLEMLDEFKGCSTFVLHPQTTIFIFLHGTKSHLVARESFKKGIEDGIVQKRNATRLAFLLQTLSGSVSIVAKEQVEKVDVMIGWRWW